MSIKDKAPGGLVISIYFLIVIFIANMKSFDNVYEKNFIILGLLGIFALAFIIIKIVDKD